MKKFLTLLLALTMMLTIMVNPASATNTTTTSVVATSNTEATPADLNGVMPLRVSRPFVAGGYDSNGKERGYVDVYTAPSITSPLNGLVTINIFSFNPVLYQVDIRVYNRSGLLWGEDNWTKLGSSNVFTAVNVTGISIRIKPRADLVTRPKAFDGEIIY